MCALPFNLRESNDGLEWFEPQFDRENTWIVGKGTERAARVEGKIKGDSE
jgi:hypothetical protein